MNRSFNWTEKASISFRDVTPGSSFYEEVAKAVKAGYIQGYEDGTFGANKSISRQEAAVMIARARGFSQAPSTATPFSDSSSIASWAKDAVNNTVARRIISGYAVDNTLRPLDPIKRDEAALVVNRAVAPLNSLSILAYGATPNDGQDDLPAIKLAVEAAKAQGKGVYVPSGEFNLNGLLTLDSVDLTGDGETSILKSMDLKLQSIILTGEGTDLSAVKLISVPATVRLTNDDSARVRVGPDAKNYSITNIVIDGGSSVGFFNAGKQGVIRGNTVKNMLADGIHITALSSDILVENNTVQRVGDDFIAVVSYEKFGGWVKNVIIRNNNVSDGEARGLTVSGGENVLVENNKVSDIDGAGIYLSSEGNYKTYAVKDTIVRNNTVMNDSRDAASPTQGGLNITATNKNPSLVNVVIENNTFSNSHDNGVLIAGTFEIKGVQFKNNAINNPKNYGILIVKTIVGDVNLAGNKVTNSGKAIYANQSSDKRIVSDLTNESGGNGGTGASSVAAYGKPAIDGVIDPLWKDASVLQMNTAATGATGTARIAWDENALYYLFEMKDSTPFAVAANEKNDSVEVWVDELNKKNGAKTVGDYQMRVDLKNAVSTSMKGLNLTNVVSAVKEVEGGYLVEFAVPYRELKPAAGTIIGFNASANDDSNGDGVRNAFVTWVDKNLPYWADTKVYNEVKLAAPKK
nr:sugar-binding protein [Paenibacillus qinlingensis]